MFYVYAGTPLDCAEAMPFPLLAGYMMYFLWFCGQNLQFLHLISDVLFY